MAEDSVNINDPGPALMIFEGRPETLDLTAAVAAIRYQASRLSPTGATAMALNATADALEALT